LDEKARKKWLSEIWPEFFADNQDRLTVYDLPSYSPDYNPIEKLWKKVKKDGTHLHYFATFRISYYF